VHTRAVATLEHVQVTAEEIEKLRRKVRAAGVFADNAEVIVAKVQALPEAHHVVAVVTANYEFSGVHHVSRVELVEQVVALEGDGWAMVFSPGADVAHVAQRTDEMVNLANKRIELIERVLSRDS